MTIQSDSVLPAALRDRWPYAPRHANVNGWRMHYVDEGEGDPVVLLHGNPTWGFLYRDMIAPLVSAGRRVIVPDMIGFGLSEKPTREQAHYLGWSHRQSDRADASARSDADHTGLPRLGRSDRALICHEQSGRGPCSDDHEHLGVAHAAGGIPHPHLPLADDACPLVGPYLLGNHARWPARGVYLSVVDREKFAATAQSGL